VGVDDERADIAKSPAPTYRPSAPAVRGATAAPAERDAEDRDHDAHGETEGRRKDWRQRSIAMLAAVAVVHAVMPLALLGPHWGLGIDESIYLSQINAHVPAGLFSAPRARGITFLAAPVTALTDSTAALRVWLSVLSAIGLFTAYRPWLRVYGGPVVAIAALLFSSIWSVAYYGFEAMPNEWVAFAVLAAAGHLTVFLRDARGGHLVWLAIAMAVAALLRPSDAGFAAVGLVAACVLIRAPRRLRLRGGLTALAGVGLGTAEWVVEAYTRFGGLDARVHAAQAEQGGGGLTFSGLAQARSLAGPLLCRAGCHADAALVFRLWWIAGAVLILMAVWLGRRRFGQGPDLIVLLVALTGAAQYLFTVGYAAPRFLIPSYALLALPCASAATQLRARASRGRPRIALTGALVGALLAHAFVQVDVVLADVKPPAARFSRQVQADAAALHKLGVRTPCIVLGQPSWNEALAYAARCRNVPRTAATVQELRARGSYVVWLGPSAPPARYGASWRQIALPGPSSTVTQMAYLGVCR
jgi:hypothetical protein